MNGPSGVRILPAASGLPDLASLAGAQRRRLLEALTEISSFADAVLVDTGAGIGDTTLSLQLAATRVLVVTTTEPTSLVDAYASLKILWSAAPDKQVDLVVSDVRSDEEASRASKQLVQACRHFLGREPGLLGPVYHDPRLPEAVRRQRALLELYPTSPAARCYERIALRLAMDPSTSRDAAGYWQRLAGSAQREVTH